MTTREKTRQVNMNGCLVGGGAPIKIQSMTNTKTENVDATVAQIHALEKAGCDIVRVAVPHMEAAKAIADIKRQIHIPLVADIHFDYRLALECIAQGIDKIRINPGNIGAKERVEEVVRACKVKKIPIRIGVNGGSLEKHILEKHQHPTAEALVESAMYHVNILEELDFFDIIISIKSSNVTTTIEAYRLMASLRNYPLHLGITEAGTLQGGTIKSSVGLGIMLYEGLGDTLRVSLTSDPVDEISVAKKILQSLDLYKKTIEIVSCPTCGRTSIDLIGLAIEAEKRIGHLEKPIKVAIMGCAVNGPGEAREADIGIAGGNGVGLIFRKGEIINKVNEEDLLETLIEEVMKM
jgi:(E)-4-hydroxy-3-methylbut-2-enyl-diphosphate synthase